MNQLPKVPIKLLKQNAANFRIFVNMKYNSKGVKVTNKRVEADFLQGIAGDEIDLIIFGRDIFYGLSIEDTPETRAEDLDLSKTAYYLKYNRILNDLYTIYSGKFKIVEQL